MFDHMEFAASCIRRRAGRPGGPLQWRPATRSSPSTARPPSSRSRRSADRRGTSRSPPASTTARDFDFAVFDPASEPVGSYDEDFAFDECIFDVDAQRRRRHGVGRADPVLLQAAAPVARAAAGDRTRRRSSRSTTPDASGRRSPLPGGGHPGVRRDRRRLLDARAGRPPRDRPRPTARASTSTPCDFRYPARRCACPSIPCRPRDRGGPRRDRRWPARAPPGLRSIRRCSAGGCSAPLRVIDPASPRPLARGDRYRRARRPPVTARRRRSPGDASLRPRHRPRRPCRCRRCRRRLRRIRSQSCPSRRPGDRIKAEDFRRLSQGLQVLADAYALSGATFGHPFGQVKLALAAQQYEIARVVSVHGVELPSPDDAIARRPQGDPGHARRRWASAASRSSSPRRPRTRGSTCPT